MAKKCGQLLYEGKAKKIFSTDQAEKVLIEFKNDATAFNAEKHRSFEGKGATNCRISTLLFQMLEANGVPTHFLEQVDQDSVFAQRVEIFPIEVVLRNIATGSLCKETPIIDGTKLERPLIDYYYKDDALKDPLITESRLAILKLITSEQLAETRNLTLKTNKFLCELFDSLDLILVDFKVEYGVNSSGNILLADEITPDTCRIWDKRTVDPEERILDKDRFRKDLGGVVEAYGEILKRIQGSSTHFPNCR